MTEYLLRWANEVASLLLLNHTFSPCLDSEGADASPHFPFLPTLYLTPHNSPLKTPADASRRRQDGARLYGVHVAPFLFESSKKLRRRFDRRFQAAWIWSQGIWRPCRACQRPGPKIASLSPFPLFSFPSMHPCLPSFPSTRLTSSASLLFPCVHGPAYQEPMELLT